MHKYCIFFAHYCQIVPIFEASIVDKSQALSNSRFYSLVVDLLAYLLKVTAADDSEKRSAASDTYQKLAKEIYSNVLANLETGDIAVIRRLQVFIEQLLINQPSSGQKSEKARSIRFAEAKLEVPTNATTIVDVGPIANMLLEDLDGMPWKLVVDSCCFAVDRAQTQSSLPHLELWAKIVTVCRKDQLLLHMIENQGGRCANNDVDSPSVSFLHRIVLPWLATCGSKVGGDVDCFVSVIGTVFRRLSGPEKLSLLSDLVKRSHDNAVFYQVLTSLMGNTGDVLVRAWLRGDEYREFLINITKGLCQQQFQQVVIGSVDVYEPVKDKRWGLLCIALSVDDEFGRLFGFTIEKKLVSTVTKAW